MIKLIDTNADAISAALINLRHQAGSPAMDMAMTLVIVFQGKITPAAVAAAKLASNQHPSRTLIVLLNPKATKSQLNAEITVGGKWSGELAEINVLGAAAAHADSVILPLLLPDSPTVVWWPQISPPHPVKDQIGKLASRRITSNNSQQISLAKLAKTYAPGDTDLSWTRITGWRAILAASLDQHPAKVLAVTVAGPKNDLETGLLAEWLAVRLKVSVKREITAGTSINKVSLATKSGEILVQRKGAQKVLLELPNSVAKLVPLPNRALAELLAEELKRIDEDTIYAQVLRQIRRAKK